MLQLSGVPLPPSPSMQRSPDAESTVAGFLAAACAIVSHTATVSVSRADHDTAHGQGQVPPATQARRTDLAGFPSLRAFHERHVKEGRVRRCDVAVFWMDFVNRGGLDALLAYSDALGDETVNRCTAILFSFCCSISKRNTGLQARVYDWIPENPHHLLRVFESCIGKPGTSEATRCCVSDVFWVSVEMQQLIRWFLPRFGADTRDLVISIFVVDDGSNLPMMPAETETILACVPLPSAALAP
jgi:hypothetical protein